MDRIQLFESWAPATSPWSPWAKPVLFAEMGAGPPTNMAPTDAPKLDIRQDSHTAIVVDLPGANAVRTGLALAGDGYRPVPLFNGTRGASLGPNPLALVDVEPIITELWQGAQVLSRTTLAPTAPPAFLLDANRQAPRASFSPGRYDNCWLVFPQDFPSAAFLRSQDIKRVLLLQHQGNDVPASDLAHVLLRWRQAGLELFWSDPAGGGVAQSLLVRQPSRFRALWQRAFALAGLRRNTAGGFGSMIPQPSSGGA